jgi:hypothetical protein
MADKRSEEEIRAEADKVMRELDFYEAEARARGLRVERIDEETLLRKLAGDEANSPFFSQIGWNNAPPGGTALIVSTIYNPDQGSYSAAYLYAYLFFGPANPIQSTDLSLTVVDPRFPHYWLGIGILPLDSKQVSFTIAVPTDISPGVYPANCYLVLRETWFEGRVLQRSSIDFEVQ